MRATGLVLSLLVGCAGSGRDATPNPDDPRDYVGKDAQVEYATLKFLNADEKERFDRARKCFAERASDWEHYPLRKIGNFVEEDWCTGEGARHGCSGGSFRDRPGAQWASVGTLHYPKDWPEVFGVQVSAGRNGDADNWSVWVSGSSNGKRILGDGGAIGFGRGEQQFYIGDDYAWTIAESRFVVDGKVDAWTLIDRVRKSPEAMREEALTHWTALETQVLAALDAGEVLECVYGEYKGDGTPPECEKKVPLPPEKVEAESARIRDHVAWIRSSLQDEGAKLHAALLELAPPDCF